MHCPPPYHSATFTFFLGVQTCMLSRCEPLLPYAGLYWLQITFLIPGWKMQENLRLTDMPLIFLFKWVQKIMFLFFFSFHTEWVVPSFSVLHTFQLDSLKVLCMSEELQPLSMWTLLDHPIHSICFYGVSFIIARILAVHCAIWLICHVTSPVNLGEPLSSGRRD